MARKVIVTIPLPGGSTTEISVAGVIGIGPRTDENGEPVAGQVAVLKQDGTEIAAVGTVEQLTELIFGEVRG